MYFTLKLFNYLEIYFLHYNRVKTILLKRKITFVVCLHRNSLATSRHRSLPLAFAYIFSIETRRYRRANLYSKRRYIRDRVCVVSLKRSLVRKRSGGEKEIYRGLFYARAATKLSGTLFYANRLSFFLVSRRALSLRAAEEEPTLTPRVTFITISQMQSVPGN